MLKKLHKPRLTIE